MYLSSIYAYVACLNSVMVSSFAYSAINKYYYVVYLPMAHKTTLCPFRTFSYITTYNLILCNLRLCNRKLYNSMLTFCAPNWISEEVYTAVYTEMFTVILLWVL